MNGNEDKRKGLGALDYLILVLVAAILAGVGYRWYRSRNDDASEGAQMDNYILNFEIHDIRDSSAQNFMEAGTNFYLADSDQLLGTLREGVTVRECEKYYELDNGELVKVSTDLTGELYRVDVEASLTVKGRMDEDGRFMLDGNKYVGLNQSFSVYSKYLALTLTVTGISLAE